jgi:hypothetical protein
MIIVENMFVVCQRGTKTQFVRFQVGFQGEGVKTAGYSPVKEPLAHLRRGVGVKDEAGGEQRDRKVLCHNGLSPGVGWSV